jgi:hypothetical protein
MYKFDELFAEYTAFFNDSVRGYDEINRVFERMVIRAEELAEKYGGPGEDGEADEYENARLARLRMLQRDMTSFAKNCSVSLGALKAELDSKIEFAEAMLEEMG